MLIIAGCGTRQPVKQEEGKSMFTGNAGEVKLMTLDPGHFHAALVQKTMYGQVDPVVHVYAPEGQDVLDHLARIEAFNSRADNPTKWDTKLYTGEDFFEKMIREKPGNVVILSGNNAKKSEYILKSVGAGLNVLADKPMIITPEQLPVLEEAFRIAGEKHVMLYDIMTERYEITTILQRELSKIPEVFGQLQAGTPEEPAITKESVHHFCKMVSGAALKRPAWFFDTDQQGEGIVDVTTHLVDLIQWEAFPETVLKKEDVELLSARRWTTDLTPGMFKKVTLLDEYPGFLKKNVTGNILKVYSNGEINYKIRGIHAKVSVVWNFEAPEGTGDTHYSIMRGSLSNIIIRQGEEQSFKPTLYVEAISEGSMEPFEGGLSKAVNQDLAAMYPGIKLVKVNKKTWIVEIPDKYKEGHEAHFGQVAEKFLRYLVSGKMADGEIPNMIVKYHTITGALKLARQ